MNYLKIYCNLIRKAEKKISRYRMSQVWLGRKESHSGWRVTRILRDK